MTPRELSEAITYANSLASTNDQRKKIIQDMLENAKGDELRDLDLNTLTWLLGGLEKAEKNGQRSPLKREHLVLRSHDHNRAEMKPQVTVRARSRITDPRGINAASETTGSGEYDDPEELPDTWISREGEVIPD